MGSTIAATKGAAAGEFTKPLPDGWNIRYRNPDLLVRPTGFKHTGLFPEQAVNWDYMASCIQARKEAAPREELRVLNLFAYTGGATMACARAGAAVAHVDSARGMVAWAKDNARLCGLKDAPIRYLVDDCLKFVRREQRRGRTYHGIVMDPPPARPPAAWLTSSARTATSNFCKPYAAFAGRHFFV